MQAANKPAQSVPSDVLKSWTDCLSCPPACSLLADTSLAQSTQALSHRGINSFANVSTKHTGPAAPTVLLMLAQSTQALSHRGINSFANVSTKHTGPAAPTVLLMLAQSTHTVYQSEAYLLCGVVFFGPRYVSAVIDLDNKSQKELVKVSKLAPSTHIHTHTHTHTHTHISPLASRRSGRCTFRHFGVAAVERGLNEWMGFWETLKM